MTTSTATTVEILPVGTWAIDPVHSSIGFEIEYLGGTFRGRFSEVDARFDAGEQPVLTGSARVQSVEVQDENLAAHLLGPDFFDAERHPELRFESEIVGRSGNALQIEGELTMKGVTKPIELEGTVAEPVVDPYGRERVAVDLETTIDRTEFGIDWNVALPSGEPALSNEVRLAAQLFLVKEA